MTSHSGQGQPYIWIFLFAFQARLSRTWAPCHRFEQQIGPEMGPEMSEIQIWLVVWNMAFMTFHNIGNNHPN